MREDHAIDATLFYTSENALMSKSNDSNKYNNNRFFHLVPIARKIIINVTSVSGGQVKNVTNVINQDMGKMYGNPKILKKMSRS